MKSLITFFAAMFIFIQANAQTKWFSPYNDSTALVTDANQIVQQLAKRISKLNPKVNLQQNIAIKNTQPYLIFINNNTINLPFWKEVIPQQQKFFAEVAGGENEGKEVFGLFFNGFYLAHELGHSFNDLTDKKFDNEYDSEYAANTFAIIYWKAAGEAGNLKRCYNYAQKMLKTLKNPVPENVDFKKYITDNYQKLAADPYKYGYIQFSQFVEIYNNKKLPNFDTYIKNN